MDDNQNHCFGVGAKRIYSFLLSNPSMRREPCFLCRGMFDDVSPSGKVAGYFVFDNMAGDFFCEFFRVKKYAIRWLNDFSRIA